MTPILPHTTSEAYDLLPQKDQEDIYLTEMPDEQVPQDSLEAAFDAFMKYREQILKALEDARSQKIIGKSFNAKLTLSLDAQAQKVFDALNSNIAQLLIVSQLEMKSGDVFTCKVEAAQGCTCQRCWMIVPQVNENGLCERCQKLYP